jgi:hypothetical protein
MAAAATGIFLNRGSASKKVPDTFSDNESGPSGGKCHPETSMEIMMGRGDPTICSRHPVTIPSYPYSCPYSPMCQNDVRQLPSRK